MQLFQVLRSIETQLIPTGNLKDIISPSSTYLLFRSDVRTIIVVHGSKSSLVTYLIGLKLANEYRKSLLQDYQVYAWDENETFEKIGNVPIQSEGLIHELTNPHLHVNLNDQGLPFSNNEYSELQIQLSDSAWKSHLSLTKLQVFADEKINVLLDQIEKLAPVPGYHLEMFLIGDTLYIPFKELDGFFLQSKFQQKFLKLGQLPEGKFFKEGYSSQLLISNRRIQALILYRSDNDRSDLGEIRAPVLGMENVTKIGDFDLLQSAFHIPPENQK